MLYNANAIVHGLHRASDALHKCGEFVMCYSR